MYTFMQTITRPVEVVYLQAQCHVRYWEDSEVNGIEDEDGKLIPCRKGEIWEPIIELESGLITNWEKGKTADVHYKVCDAGCYSLLDANKEIVEEIEGYVPSILCPKENGYGDYVIMNIDEDGYIEDWEVTPEFFDLFSNDNFATDN